MTERENPEQNAGDHAPRGAMAAQRETRYGRSSKAASDLTRASRRAAKKRPDAKEDPGRTPKDR